MGTGGHMVVHTSPWGHGGVRVKEILVDFAQPRENPTHRGTL